MTTSRLSILPALFSSAVAVEPAVADAPRPPRQGNAEPSQLAANETTRANTSEDPATTTTATTTAESPTERYPRAVIERPLTLPAGVAMLGGDSAGNHDLSTVAVTPIAGYGITDDLDVQVPYTFTAHTLEAAGTLDVDVGYKLLRGALGGTLEAIARVRGGYDLNGSTADALRVGVHVQYNALDWLAIITGSPGNQQLQIALADDASSTKPIDLSVPLGVGVQPTGTLYLELDTVLAQFALHHSATRFIGADTTPLSLTAVYNVLRELDVQGTIGTDVSSSPGDNLSFLVGVRYYTGEL